METTESPRDRERQRSLRDLRRRPDDRVIGGVAASIARALDLDPVIVRIAFVALAVFGGSGVVLYLVAWALIPEEPDDRSWVLRTLEGANGALGVILLALGALIAVPVLFSLLWLGPWDGRGSGILLPVALIAVGAVLLTRGRTDGGASPSSSTPGAGPTWPPPTWSPPSGPAADPAAGPPGAPAGPTPAATTTGATAPGATATGALPWPPPGTTVGHTTPRPTTPRRRGSSVVTPVTLSVALIGLGVAAAAHQAGAMTLTPAAAIAGLLVVVGAGLLVGALRGGARGLIAPGIVLAVALGPALVLPTPIWPGMGDRTYVPTTLEELSDEYRLGAGSLRLDLRGLDLDGAARRVEVGVTLGEAEILLPDGIEVQIDARAAMGEVDVIGYSPWSGLRAEITGVRPAGPDGASGAGTLELVVEVGIGAVVVR